MSTGVAAAPPKNAPAAFSSLASLFEARNPAIAIAPAPDPRKLAGVLDAFKARPGSIGASRTRSLPAGLDRVCARRPSKYAVGTEECLRRGRTKE
jgi:hypothetical protein